jgi:hypothetical protein
MAAETRTYGPLRVHEVVALGNIVAAASGTEKVARLTDGGVIYGTARRIGPAFGEAYCAKDVRDQYLWVTTSGGFEVWWSVSDLMAEAQTGEFARYDWS